MFLEAILRMKYSGKIYPVNPKADTIGELRVYHSIRELPEKPDLAIVLLPYQYALQSLEEIGQNGISHVIVISAGFKEIGGEGIQREKELQRLVAQYQMNALGPNCMGIFNTDPQISFNGTFSPTLPRPGHVAYISQSGALGVAILELAAHTDLGFSVFVSTGNKADISDHDVLEFLAGDSNTNVITLYLESIHRPDDFRKICMRLAAIKPILAVKAGRTGSGVKAASSHTGALANPEHIIDGFLKQCGVLRKDSLEELFDAARALSTQPLPAGNRVAVITNAGGPGILASDAIESNGMRLAEFLPETVARLKRILPEEAACGNPVDMIASADHNTYHDALEIILSDPGVDSILLIIVKPPVNTTPQRIVAGLESLAPNCGKPILAVLMAQRDESAGLALFEKLRIPVYSYPESAVKALATMYHYQRTQQRFRKSEAVAARPAAADDASDLRPVFVSDSPAEIKQVNITRLFSLLNEYGIPCPPYLVTSDLSACLQFQQKYAGKMVLKIANEQIIHKSDEGFLRLNLDSEAAMQNAFREMQAAALKKLPAGTTPLFLIQKQAPGGLEMVIGGKRDAVFGPVVMVGVGGILVEALKDVSFRIAPVNVFEAKEMLAELRAQVLLNGFRGMPRLDRDAFAYTISQFSLLLVEHTEITEMDLNPLICSADEKDALVVDVRASIA
jgi:acetyltransferase